MILSTTWKTSIACANVPSCWLKTISSTRKIFKFMERIPGEMQISYSRDTCVDDDDKTMHEPEVLNRINSSGVPPHRLPLKIGAMIVLIKKFDICNGHCNGTRYLITHLTKTWLKQKSHGWQESKIANSANTDDIGELIIFCAFQKNSVSSSWCLLRTWRSTVHKIKLCFVEDCFWK